MKRLFRWIGIGFLLLFLVLFVKTIQFSSKQVQVEPISLRQLGEEPIQRLAQSIRIPSISSIQNFDSAAFRQLDTFITNSFPRVHRTLKLEKINDFARVYEWPGKNPNLTPVMLIAHLDVVPASDGANAWTQEPFSGAVVDGFVWGRGTLDDKVSAMAILEAAEALLAQNYAPERSIYFGFGHDEEIGGDKGARAIVQYLKDQKVQLEYVLDEGYFIIEEALPGLEAPLGLIGLSEKGYVTLEVKVQLEDGGHSSMPPNNTAIGMLSKAIQKLEEHPFPAKIDGIVRQTLEYAGPEMSPAFKTLFANLWLTEGLIKKQFEAAPTSNALIRTTTAPTVINGGIKDNILPTQASALINFRIIPGETPESVLARVKKLIGSDYIQVKILESGGTVAPSPISSNTAFGFEVIQKTIREVFPGTVVAPGVMVGQSDARHYASISNNLYRFLPFQVTSEDIQRIHGIDERIGVDQYKLAIQWYERLIQNSCK